MLFGDYYKVRFYDRENDVDVVIGVLAKDFYNVLEILKTTSWHSSRYELQEVVKEREAARLDIVLNNN